MADLGSVLAQPWLLATLLLSVRIAALLLLTPVLYALDLPPLVRVLVVLGVSAVLAAPLAGSPRLEISDAGALLQAVLREAAVGATLGLGILAAFAGFSLAGRLLDVQVGFGIGQVFDPLTRTRVPVLSSVFSLLAAVLFFAVNGHHALLRGIAFSLQRFRSDRALRSPVRWSQWPGRWPASSRSASRSPRRWSWRCSWSTWRSPSPRATCPR